MIKKFDIIRKPRRDITKSPTTGESVAPQRDMCLPCVKLNLILKDFRDFLAPHTPKPCTRFLKKKNLSSVIYHFEM